MKLQANYVFGSVQIATWLLLVWLSYQCTEAREQVDRAVEMLKQYQTYTDACLDQAEGTKEDFAQCVRFSNRCQNELNECTKTNTACFNFFTADLE